MSTELPTLKELNEELSQITEGMHDENLRRMKAGLEPDDEYGHVPQPVVRDFRMAWSRKQDYERHAA